MSAEVSLSPGAEVAALPGALPLEAGGALDPAHVAFEILGLPGAPVVVVQGGISSGRHAASSPADPSPGWWEAFVGPGKAVDTKRFRVLSLDFLGGAGGSTGPARAAEAGAPPFPAVTSHDQARATARLLDLLGIGSLHAFVGGSYGGMVGLALARLCPERLARLVAISAPARPHPLATAWRSLQRRILKMGLETGGEDSSVALARAVGMATYRSDREFALRFDVEPRREGGDVRFPVEAYLEARGRGFSERLHARAYLALSLALDLHRVEPEEIRVPATIVGATSDRLVPPGQLEELARRLGGPAELVLVDSLYGHDAFLKEDRTIGAAVAWALEEGGIA